ncbi:MAG: L,D-transpeptidase [Anaerolineales bacterium]|nr:L,D-transpeptidase [Anaerolineales bacterium]
MIHIKMRRLIAASLLAFLLSLLLAVPELLIVKADTPETPVDYACTGRDQLRFPRQCSNIGPAENITGLALLGALSNQPLPAVSPDPNLNYLPFEYLRVGKSGTAKYGSVDDALDRKNTVGEIPPGYLFVSYIDRIEKNGKIIYMIEPGVYIRGDNVSRYTPPEFQGLIFNENPIRPFGWIMGGNYVSTAPGLNQPAGTRWAYRYEVIQIYDTRNVDGLDWYMIGPEEWVEQRLVALVYPNPERPEGIPDNRWIEINLYEQTISLYEDGRLQYATLVSSGSNGWWTQPGVFQVYAKLETDTMSGAFASDRSDYYYLEDVPWVMYYDEARAIHGAYWHNNYGYPTSHGCVNLSHADAQWIFDWSQEGTWVYVWDPSGETPTDPDVYTPGGA